MEEISCALSALPFNYVNACSVDDPSLNDGRSFGEGAEVKAWDR
jgi:hypothetical protein